MKYFILFILFITIICLIVGCRYPPVEGGREDDLAKKVLKNVKNSDPARVREYLEIQSGLTGKSRAEVINHIAKKKHIQNADEFMERLNMGPYTFMTALEQFEFDEKLGTIENK